MSSADYSIEEQKAAELTKQGQFEEAEHIYKLLIDAGTKNYISFGNMAAICGMQGRLDEAVALLKRALELKPDYPNAHNNLGLALIEKGDFHAAISCFNKTLELQPCFETAHFNLGNALTKTGDLNAALASFKKELELNPKSSKTHYALGIIFREQGNLKAATASMNNAIELNPDNPEAHFNLGLTHFEKGEVKAAIVSFNKAIELNPNSSQAHNGLGGALNEEGDVNAAIASFNRALELNPNYPNAHYNLGISSQKKGDLNAAITSFNKALELNPNYLNAYLNLSNTLKEKGDINAAIDTLSSALEIKNDFVEAYSNLGNLLKANGNINAAIEFFKKALEIKPDFQEAHLNCSTALLLGGDYENGWKEYEWRAKKDKAIIKAHATPKCTQWCGEKLPEGRKLLVVSEQGLGDTLQFMRYTRALQRQGISTSLCAQTKLHTLIQASGLDPCPLTPEQASQVDQGEWIRLLSLPRYLEVSPNNPVITKPYIKTTKVLSTKWRKILESEKQPIIGINWQGNPEAEKNGLHGRSLPLESFSSIITNIPATFLSLQKGFGSEQLETCSFKKHFVNCQDQVNQAWDFLETAAIIDNCDLIITSDTSVAHLAGGMGKATWLLLPKNPDWRWGLDGETTFWYPSMHLFRQKEHGNWGEVLEQVSVALLERYGNRTRDTKNSLTTPQHPLNSRQSRLFLLPFERAIGLAKSLCSKSK